MKTIRVLTFVLLALAGSSLLRAADLVGKWTTEFDTQIGIQKYVYEFKVSGDRLVGRATFQRSLGNGEVELRSIKLDGDTVSFVEPFSFEGTETPITYSGVITGDEMKLTRNVGDFATEQLVARREKAAGAKSAGPR